MVEGEVLDFCTVAGEQLGCDDTSLGGGPPTFCNGLWVLQKAGQSGETAATFTMASLQI